MRKHMPNMGSLHDPVAYITAKLGWREAKFAVSSRSRKDAGGDGSVAGIAILSRFEVKLSRCVTAAALVA